MAFICSPSPSAYSPPPTPGRAALGLHSPSPRVCTGGRAGVRTKFSCPHGFTKNSYPWCSAGALRAQVKFLWKGADKVTRLSTTNDYQKSGFKMIDLETMVKSLRQAWLKRIFSENDGTWKNYLHHLLKSSGGLFILFSLQL